MNLFLPQTVSNITDQIRLSSCGWYTNKTTLNSKPAMDKNQKCKWKNKLRFQNYTTGVSCQRAGQA